MSGRPQDRFGRQAKRDGFAARSVYKLEEIDTRVRLLKPGQHVLDLGASPGSWTQYATSRVGPSGSVTAVDLKPLNTALALPHRFVLGDAFTLADDVYGERAFDVVLSDMAPSTSGDKFVDQCRSFDLFTRALDVAEARLRLGGSFVGKIFQGPDFNVARARMTVLFSTSKVIRPEATRSESYEVFLVGVGKV